MAHTHTYVKLGTPHNSNWICRTVLNILYKLMISRYYVTAIQLQSFCFLYLRHLYNLFKIVECEIQAFLWLV